MIGFVKFVVFPYFARDIYLQFVIFFSSLMHFSSETSFSLFDESRQLL
jgi:hypothetical protein